MDTHQAALLTPTRTWLDFEDMQQLLLDGSPTLALSLDLQGRIRWINAAGAQHLGYGEGELTGRELAGSLVPHEALKHRADELSEERGEALPADAGVFSADLLHTHEWLLRHKDGSPHPTLLTIGPLRDTQGEVTGLIAIEPSPDAQGLRPRFSHHDPLTGLPTRALLADRAEMALQRATRQHSVLAVMLIEILNFEALCKELGHSVGDDVLRATAGRLHFELRKTDAAAPMDRGQFAAMLVDLHHSDEARVVAEKIQKAVSTQINVGVAFLPLVARVGVAWYPQHGDQLLPLLQAAESALALVPEGQGGVAMAPSPAA